MPISQEVAEAIRSSARVVSIPMRTRFRGVDQREVLLFEGTHGWAEWSPFVEYEDSEAAVWLKAAVEFAFAATPDLLRTSVGVNATLPAVAPEQVPQTLEPFGRFNTVKIKVAEPGQGLNDDLQRIYAVRRAFPEARIRLDANGGYSPELAETLGRSLFENGIKLDYFEQPVQTIEELARLRTSLNPLGIKIAADESIRKSSDPLAVVAAHAADIMVIKAAPLGGVSSALDIVQQAALPAVVSSALETSVGISMGLHLAGALPNLDYDCGLATVALLTDDVCENPLMPVNGSIEVRRAVPAASKLESLAATSERTDWWLNRLDRCLQLL